MSDAKERRSQHVCAIRLDFDGGITSGKVFNPPDHFIDAPGQLDFVLLNGRPSFSLPGAFIYNELPDE